MSESNVEQQSSETTQAISEWTINFLQNNLNISEGWVKYLNMIFLTLLVVVVVFVLQFVVQRILKAVLQRVGRLPKMSFLNHLVNRKFHYYLALIVPFGFVKGSIPVVFYSFPKAMAFMHKFVDIYLIFFVMWLISSVINAFGDSLRHRPAFRDKPIDGYTQLLKIFLYFIGGITLIAILIDRDPLAMFAGLGAASAILLLVFKDTIMGLVASVQVSSNDMVRIGDWITMPKYGVDGDVININLTTVKILNFDRTITTIPPYSLVSEAFQNWRGMVDAGGRRLKRSLFIKQSSIRFVYDEELERLQKIQYIGNYIRERSAEIKAYNEEVHADKSLGINGRNLTNMGLFRRYVETYLRNHSGVHQDLLLLVRQLQPTSTGLPLELYFFTSTTKWTEYENIVSDIFDHVTSAVKYFDLELFEDVSNPLHLQKEATAN